ncbi:MAG: alanine racemase [Ruminococcus sp.]|nr:alanine racemase [Ruminococcus sp.]
MKLYKRTWAEIDLDRLKQNYIAYKRALPQDTEIMCVVKASCYGHSDRAAVPFLQNELDVKHFAVSNLEEAVRLRSFGITGEILILGYTSPDEAQALEKYDIIQAIMDFDYARSLNDYALSSVRCHIAVDTGMARIGLRGTAEEISDEIVKIAALDKLKIEGAFTHFAVADSLEDDCAMFTKAQSELFFSAADEAKKKGVKLETLHTLNSAAGLFHTDSRSSLARLGIVLYGLKPDRSLDLPSEIKPVMSLKSTVSQVKEVEQNVSVSYGRSYFTASKAKLATVCCGYADGYPRLLSNIGEVLVHGRRCKIVGRVCMDQFMCDVTGIDVRAGDIVTLIGHDGSESITADDLAKLTGTIGYEIVCSVSERVPRAAVKNGNIVGVYKL